MAESNIGIICLTKDNTEKPWLLFEAGALPKSLDGSRVHPLLFDIEPSEIKGPLAGLQLTRFQRDEFKKLIISINKAAEESQLEPGVIDDVFDTWWPQLEKRINSILAEKEDKPKRAKRSDRDILEELLELSRMNFSRTASLSVTAAAATDRTVLQALSDLEHTMMFANDKDLEVAFSRFRELFENATNSAGNRSSLGALEAYGRSTPHAFSRPTNSAKIINRKHSSATEAYPPPSSPNPES